MSKSILHKADSRGYANHGWLEAKHTFSFASYYNSERIHFGALRVLNDDSVAGGEGFGMHPHDNMEIITIPLQGSLAHKDTMGNASVINSGDIQVMSAGTGVQHSEFNNSKDEKVSLLQIWVFPNKKNVEPRYEQLTLNKDDRHNKLQQIISPNANEEGLWIHQNAWFHLAQFDKGHTVSYKLKSKENGLYVFNLSGDIKVDNQLLNIRDGFGVWDTDEVVITAESDAEFLLMEVPMVF